MTPDEAEALCQTLRGDGWVEVETKTILNGDLRVYAVDPLSREQQWFVDEYDYYDYKTM